MTWMGPVYGAFLEVRPTERSEMDPSRYAGAFVTCYVASHDLEDAVARIRKSLVDDGFVIVRIIWCGDMDELDVDPDSSPDGKSLVDEARQTDEVLYSAFQGWTHDAKDVAN